MKNTLCAIFFTLALFLPSLLPAQTTAIASRQPANQAKNVCPDTHLTLAFDRAPTLGTVGQIRIYDAANDQLVDTIDNGVPATSQNYIIGGANNFHLYPVLPNGNTAIIYPHHHVLDYHAACQGHTYLFPE